MTSKLLASSSTLEGIQKLITDFYCSSTITLEQVSKKEWNVFTLKGLCKGVKVYLKKNRYRFEMI
jgi:hypothetical protein